MRNGSEFNIHHCAIIIPKSTERTIHAFYAEFRDFYPTKNFFSNRVKNYLQPPFDLFTFGAG